MIYFVIVNGWAICGFTLKFVVVNMRRFLYFLVTLFVTLNSESEEICRKEQFFLDAIVPSLLTSDVGDCYVDYSVGLEDKYNIIIVGVNGVDSDVFFSVSLQKYVPFIYLNKNKMLFVGNGLSLPEEARKICSSLKKHNSESRMLRGGVYSLPDSLYSGVVELSLFEAAKAVKSNRVTIFTKSSGVKFDGPLLVAKESWGSYIEWRQADKRKKNMDVYSTSASNREIKKRVKVLKEISKHSGDVPRRYSCR